MILVLVESPYAVPDQATIDRNVAYARAAMNDCFQRGEAPFASHLLYTQPGVLRDEVPEERKLGIEAGLVWGKNGQKTVVYIDLGITPGMEKGIARAHAEGRVVEIRSLKLFYTGLVLAPTAAEPKKIPERGGGDSLDDMVPGIDSYSSNRK